MTRLGVGDVELARNRALALPNLGRLDEALREFIRFENDPSVPHWLYLSVLAGIYDGGREFERALELRRRSAARKPDASAVWIDIAYSLVRGLNRPIEAREALARAETLEITGLGKPHLFFLRGIILWRERRPSEAKQSLAQALGGFQPLAHHDLVEGLILFTKSYLCAVLRELGDSSEAKRLFAETEQFLVAHREEELLHACRDPLLADR
jgi:tetratricopeptide (TPR) repeat protein